MLACRLSFSVIALVFALVAAAPRAQCAPIPGTGCNAFTPTCNTRPVIGTTFQWSSAPCVTALPPLLIFGTVLTPPLPVQPPIVCTSSPCNLGCQPLFTAQAPSLSIPIPNLRSLVGAVFCIQSACVNTVPCLLLSQAASVTIR
jgi:hypothetical protein